MLHASNLPRYINMASLLTRYGRKDFRVNVSPDTAAMAESEDEPPLEPEVAERAKNFAAALKEMGTNLRYRPARSSQSAFKSKVPAKRSS